MKLQVSLLLTSTVLQAVSAQNCNRKPDYAAPVLADGWAAQLLTDDLDRPRSILFDSEGGLLVLEQRSGVKHLRLGGNSSCVSVDKETDLIDDDDLNHGLALSNDGKTLYASSASSVFSWTYDPSGPSISSKRTLVNGMSSGGHTSRTLLMSKKQPGILVVSRGSDGNIDLDTANITSGRSQIKAFDLSNLTADSDPYDYSTQGRLLGWGLRNSVGVAEEPVNGGIYSVENSGDQFERDGVDIHRNNPGEELNYHGFLNSSTENQGGNYGYPYCFALWDTNIPNVGDLKVGDQFSLGENATIDDAFCNDERVAPRLTFQAHMAPLDIKFEPNGSLAYVSFHGSWNRDDPTGYKVSTIGFSSGSPVAASDSKNSTTDIMTNPDLSACPGKCFRPVGLVLDGEGKLFMTSDSTGEIWVLRRTGEGSGNGTGSGGESGTPTSGEGSTPSETGNPGVRLAVGYGSWTIGLMMVGLLIVV